MKKKDKKSQTKWKKKIFFQNIFPLIKYFPLKNFFFSFFKTFFPVKKCFHLGPRIKFSLFLELFGLNYEEKEGGSLLSKKNKYIHFVFLT